ncbi:MAG TPA: DUF3500 domain-containing protein [Nocardioidaceae bacterium]
MRAEAEAFLSCLYGGQRELTTYDFTDDERYRWKYTPGPRGGLALADMERAQREQAMRLVESGLSASGAVTARNVMMLETVLRALEEEAGRPGAERRQPEHFWFTVFGDPSSDRWAWRVGGHHLCLHFTLVGDEVAVTPLFFGAHPARVPDGEHAGLRTLAEEEDLARELVRGLDESQRATAVASPEPPSDILTKNQVRAEVAAVPTGIGYGSLREDQQQLLARLVEVYRGRVRRPPPVPLEELTFVWAGSFEPGEGHYYAIRGGSFLVEYDNTQDGANHIHTVWRDLHRDWGEDLLAAHYREAHDR